MERRDREERKTSSKPESETWDHASAATMPAAGSSGALPGLAASAVAPTVAHAVHASAPERSAYAPLPQRSGSAASPRMPSDPLAAVGLREGTLVNTTYRVERALGVGGMGVVALATDEALDRKVAIKFIRPELFAFPEMRTFFHNEARAMARVSHRNVLSVFAFGEHEGTPYFVMEYVDGKTVERWLRERPPDSFPDIDEAIAILDQACLGVSAIHDSSTIHRDLKPSNLLIDRSKGPRSSNSQPPLAQAILAPASSTRAPLSERPPESGFRVAVGDLGVARVLDSATSGNFIVGSAAWMAPEAALGEDEAPELANRRDIYALGCIAYELLTGTPPFTGPTDMSILSQHVLDEPVPPSHVRPDLPTWFDGVILKALSKDPKKRWTTADAFRRALIAEYTGMRDPERILIVDDDPDWRTVIGMSLAERFREAVIDKVADGEAALRAFETNPYSVVLVDLQMPGIDGAGLTMRLRSREGASLTPIIVLTAAGGPREWQTLSAIGADAFLVKPVNADDVELVIRRTLRSRRIPVPASSPKLPVTH